MKNQRVVLASRPTGEPRPEDFRIEEVDLPALRAGEVLLKTLYLSLDPYMRGRMSDAPSYAEPARIGETMPGATICRIEGKEDIVLAYTGWQRYAAAPESSLRRLDPAIPPTASLGVLGAPGLTAYVGLLDIGQPKPGETLVVAAAAGPVGSAVGQIAKLKGCRAVGIAGGEAKCDIVVNEFGFDACIDHRSATFAEDLKAACPRGVDVYFENVGGKVFETVFPIINAFGRVPVCGLVAQYNMTQLPPAPDRTPLIMRAILTKRLTFRGFIVTDHLSQAADFYRDMTGWVRDGKIKYREDIVDGLENAIPAFIGMLKGTNVGKLIVRL